MNRGYCSDVILLDRSQQVKTFSYGAPDCIVTDNGPQFRKHTEFQKLLKEFNVKHRKVTPYHPMANGEVERFNRNLKKTIQASIAEGQNWRQALDKLPPVLPHHATCHNPAKLQQSLCLDDKRNKTTPKWNTNPGTVVKVKGNSLIIQQGAKQIMRSANQSKQYKRPVLQTHLKSKTTTSNSCSSSDDDYFSGTVDVQPTAESPNENENVAVNDSTSSDATIPYNEEDNDPEPLFIPRPQRVKQAPKWLSNYELT
ncbi:uncharacterized protein [Clytia hemisphaerica]|uniref:uncharacterized protein n=1 Tax=Clytia hemisphaerica TaxID=252671 RepID=UPI0034D7AA32